MRRRPIRAAQQLTIKAAFYVEYAAPHEGRSVAHPSLQFDPLAPHGILSGGADHFGAAGFAWHGCVDALRFGARGQALSAKR